MSKNKTKAQELRKYIKLLVHWGDASVYPNMGDDYNDKELIEKFGNFLKTPTYIINKKKGLI